MKTRPYLVTFNGKERCVEATSMAAAITHLAQQLVAAVKAATGAELARFVRAGGTIEQVGDALPTEPPVFVSRQDRGDDALDETRTHGSESAVDDTDAAQSAS